MKVVIMVLALLVTVSFANAKEESQVCKGTTLHQETVAYGGDMYATKRTWTFLFHENNTHSVFVDDRKVYAGEIADGGSFGMVLPSELTGLATEKYLGVNFKNVQSYKPNKGVFVLFKTKYSHVKDGKAGDLIEETTALLECSNWEF